MPALLLARPARVDHDSGSAGAYAGIDGIVKQDNSTPNRVFNLSCNQFVGGIAQLVERLVRNEKAWVRVPIPPYSAKRDQMTPVGMRTCSTAWRESAHRRAQPNWQSSPEAR